MQPDGLSQNPPPTTAAPDPDPQRFLEEVDSLVASSMGYEATLAGLTRIAVASFASFCIVDVLSEDRGSVRRLIAAHRDPGMERLAAAMCRFPPKLDGPNPVARVIRNGKPLLLSLDRQAVEALSLTPEHARVALQIGVVSSIVVALTARGRTLGAISLSRDASLPAFTEGDLPYAEAVAGRVSLALDHARLSESEEGARNRVERAKLRSRRHLQATAALAGAATSEEVNRVLLDALLDALQASAGAISLVDERSSELVLRFSTGFAPDVVARWRRLPLAASSPLCDAARRRDPVVLGMRDRSRREPPSETVQIPAGCDALVALPLAVGGQVLGVATFAFTGDRTFDDDERNFMALLAHEGAQALARAQLYDSAQAANTAKSNFLAVISHELRTPLTAVIGYTDLLAAETRGPLNGPQRDQLRRLKGAADQIAVLVDQILQYARFESSPQVIEQTSFDLIDLAREALHTVEPIAARKGLAITSRLPDRLEVSTDRSKLLQILLNLLTNAVKFTDRGGVELRISIHDSVIRCEVRDTGVGIAREHIEQIFERFWQVDQSDTRRIGGAGLGLSLARQLARALGGDIAVDSRPGRGSSFSLDLPAFNTSSASIA